MNPEWHRAATASVASPVHSRRSNYQVLCFRSAFPSPLVAAFPFFVCGSSFFPQAPTKKQIAEEAVAAAVAQMGVNEEGPDRADDAVMASLDPKRRKSSRVKIDPLMPRGGVAPNEWAEMENLEEGCRGILVRVP